MTKEPIRPGKSLKPRGPNEIFKDLITFKVGASTLIPALIEEATMIHDTTSDLNPKELEKQMLENYWHPSPERELSPLAETLIRLKEIAKSEGGLKEAKISEEDRTVLKKASTTLLLMQNVERHYAGETYDEHYSILPDLSALQSEVISKLQGHMTGLPADQRVTSEEITAKRYADLEKSRQHASEEVKKYDTLMTLADELCQSLNITPERGNWHTNAK